MKSGAIVLLLGLLALWAQLPPVAGGKCGQRAVEGDGTGGRREKPSFSASPLRVAWLFLPDTSLSALPLRPLYVPADPRSCYAMIPHWFYNWQAKKCENFMYGGCDGHENNFEMQTDCLGKCGGHARQGQEGIVPPLERPLGPCTAAIPRWTYNWRAKTCEEFSYGGCRGNKNNFETEVDCLQACAGHGKTHDNLGQCCYLHRAMNRSLYKKKTQISGLFTCQSQTVLLIPHTGYQEAKKGITRPPLLHSSSLAPSQHLGAVR
uniref:BPTI/Kunitz inhibitor domain-containing protein n=1 Tax=Chelydra serpentina TaxID=8475 RepID=A0A8C3SUG7_CHESE